MTTESETEEKAWAVRLMHRLDMAQDVMRIGPLRRAIRSIGGRQAWPRVSGAYIVGDPRAPVAVCTLTSNDLMQSLAHVPGVAIAGRIYTPNLGIEKIMVNVTSNSSIRFLLLCGKESPIFHPGQALQLLLRDGVTPERRILGAQGHLPVLSNSSDILIETFRQQIELIDCIGETDVAIIQERIHTLVERNPGSFSGSVDKNALLTSKGDARQQSAQFVALRPGGKRQPLVYDPKGFFVITLDQAAREIVVRHYLPDNSPAHEMRGRSAESIVLGLLREDLISQLSHAGYLGAELAKAEAALRLGLRYEQDQPLRSMGNP